MHDDRKTPYAPACLAKGDHGRPAHIDEAFPALDSTPNIPGTIAALQAGCRPCVERHVRVVSQYEPSVIYQAAYLWLGTVCLARHTTKMQPAQNGDDLVSGLFAKLSGGETDSLPQLSLPTLRLLRHLQLDQIEPPFGGPMINTWDMDQVEDTIAAMSAEDRAAVWRDLLMLLLGWLQGTQRAYAHHFNEETNR